MLAGNENTMSTPQLPYQFVENWLKAAQTAFPDSATLKAVADATQSAHLDETKLLRRLRELSKPAKEEKQDDEG